MSDHRLQLSQQIIDTCLAMNASGINHGTSGNVSARHGEGFLITPSGVPYEDLAPEMIVEVLLDGSHEGDLLPSSEWRMHRDIYASRPEAGAVVHTHSTHATAIATLRCGIPCFHYMIAVAGGTDIRCSDYATFGSAELSQTMLTAMEGRKACLLANHGYIGFGADLRKALGLAVEVESLARQYYTALQMGEPVILSDEEMAEVLEKFKSYGKQPKPAS